MPPGSRAAPVAAFRSYDERSRGIDTTCYCRRQRSLPSRSDAPDRRPLRRRLHRPAHRPPAGGAAADHGQGRRLRARARRRGRLQAAELDDAADRDRGGRTARSSCARSRARTGSRSRSARCSSDVTHAMDFDADRLEKAGVEADLQVALADAPGLVRRGLPARAARVADRHRPGRPHVPRRGRRLDRGRDQADRDDRRRRAALAATWSGSGSTRRWRRAAACSPRRS